HSRELILVSSVAELCSLNARTALARNLNSLSGGVVLQQSWNSRGGHVQSRLMASKKIDCWICVGARGLNMSFGHFHRCLTLPQQRAVLLGQRKRAVNCQNHRGPVGHCLNIAREGR